jgi:hypothetical protein
MLYCAALTVNGRNEKNNNRIEWIDILLIDCMVNLLSKGYWLIKAGCVLLKIWQRHVLVFSNVLFLTVSPVIDNIKGLSGGEDPVNCLIRFESGRLTGYECRRSVVVFCDSLHK